MWIRIASLVAMGITVFGLPAGAVEHSKHNQTFKVAQYCLPNDDEPGVKNDVYCMSEFYEGPAESSGRYQMP
jgi:hypothetical protein